jgi:hypothetical protein
MPLPAAAAPPAVPPGAVSPPAALHEATAAAVQRPPWGPEGAAPAAVACLALLLLPLPLVLLLLEVVARWQLRCLRLQRRCLRCWEQQGRPLLVVRQACSGVACGGAPAADARLLWGWEGPPAALPQPALQRSELPPPELILPVHPPPPPFPPVAAAAGNLQALEPAHRCCRRWGRTRHCCATGCRCPSHCRC